MAEEKERIFKEKRRQKIQKVMRLIKDGSNIPKQNNFLRAYLNGDLSYS